MTASRRVAPVWAIALACCACGAPFPARNPAGDTPIVKARAATMRVPNDPDDPAIWVNAADPAGSLIIGTDKQEGVGSLYVFGLDGRGRQAITPMDRPNNVDVEYGFTLGRAPVDIAVVTERMRRRLRVFRIDQQSGWLDDVSSGGGLPVLDGMAGESGEPMGIALFKRPSDGAVFAIVAPKTGGACGPGCVPRLPTRPEKWRRTRREQSSKSNGTFLVGPCWSRT